MPDVTALLEFYPTPPSLISKMLDGVDWREVDSVLEPSAGKGDIAQAVAERLGHRHRYYNEDRAKGAIDCIEIDETLRHALKGAGWRVVHDDFLTYRTRKAYDLIVMNPPFSDGDRHLLKALELAEHGGRVVCLLNAETIRNPYTFERRALARKLEELGASISFLPGEFRSAERRTDVEVALISVAVPESIPDSIILEELHEARKVAELQRDPADLVPGDFIEAIVARYRFEVDAGLRLIQEYRRLEPHLLNALRKGEGSPILQLTIDNRKVNGHLLNDYIRLTRLKYWQALFEAPEFVGQLTSDLRRELSAKVEALADYEFSRVNILSIQRDMSVATITSIEATILKLFDTLSAKHSWDQDSKNVHYYNGWATNKAWKINEKVILPSYAWDSSFGHWNYWRVSEELIDLERCLAFLSGGQPPEVSIGDALARAKEAQQSANIASSYFTVTLYKKGTCHIRFTRRDLLDRLNIFGAQRKGWLPPSYGRKTYADMSQVERAVVDEFQGAAEYARVVADPGRYIVETSALLQLGAQEAA